jgi:hypothetical protein
VLARRPAAKVPAGDKNSPFPKLGLVKRVPRILLAIILERVLAEPVECHTPEKPGRNDPIGINVIQQQRHAAARNRTNLLGHFESRLNL